MKNLSLQSIFNKNQASSDVAWLIALKIQVRNPNTGLIDEVIRVVANNEPTRIMGEEYEPFSFEISTSESSNELPTCSVTIQDQTFVVQSYMQRYGGAVGFPVDLIIVQAKSANDTEVEPELIEYFEIIESSVSDYVVKWRLGTENPLRQIFPGRRQDDEQCSFKFKSEECGYAGPVKTCDLTLNGPNGCRAKDNAENNGSYPGIIVRS